MVLSRDLKIAICFGLIIGALFSFCSMCFASEDVDLTTVSGININLNSESFVSWTSGGIEYFVIEPGFLYTVSNVGSNNRVYGFSETIPEVGASVFDGGTISPSDSFSFNGSVGYMCFASGNVPGSIYITREPLDGIDGFVDQLVYTVGTEGLWSTFLDCVPLLVLAVLWGLGFFLIVRFVIGIVKARGGV